MDDKVKNCILDFISNIKMPEYEEIFSTDIVMWAVKSAYGDAKRTMQGISCFSEEKDAALDEIGEGILEYFTVLEPATSQEEFDVLHEKLCNTWTKHFNDKLIGAYGKAQKIVNMTFKYLFCIDFGKKKYEKWFFFCHMTLDSYTLDWIRQNRFIFTENKVKVPKSLTWSKLEAEKYKVLASDAILGVKNTEILCKYTALEAEFLIWDASIIYKVSKDYQKLRNKYEHRSYLNVSKAVSAESIDDYILNM